MQTCFTSREVARIQSFPDSFKLINAEGPQYKALGNAIPPVLMWYIASSLGKLLAEYEQLETVML
ncbi:DNA cytosine methyltransferase [Psychrobacillus sp. MER TA 171]|uniref:DNA cytosine methyltransferase n=1 Tax=Psychrobacillus sp. MER TA 171 TaxID=2939577 RepID=UPI00333F9477